MATATAGHKLLKKIKDEKFDVEDLHHYSLLLQIGTRDLQLCVVDTRSNRCLLLEDFVLTGTKNFTELTQVLEALFDSHHLLKAGFWKTVKISFKNNKFSLIPTSLFVKESIYEYLKLNAKVSPAKDEFVYYRHIQFDAVNAFSVNRILYDWIIKAYPNLQPGLVHQSSGLIEGVLSQVKNHPPNAIYLYVDRFKLHIVTTRDGKLEYYNQFIIKQFPEYIKYIMTVMAGLRHDQKKTPVIMWGYVGKQSPHYHEFARYIRNLSFGDRPDFLKYGYMFDELQDHHFFDLYGLHLCA